MSDVDAIFEYAGDELSYDMARMLGIENLVAYGDFAPRDPSALGAQMAVLSGSCEVSPWWSARSPGSGATCRRTGQCRLHRAPGSGTLPYGVVGGMTPSINPRFRCDYARSARDITPKSLNVEEQV